MWLENHNESIRCDNAIFCFVICLNKTKWIRTHILVWMSLNFLCKCTTNQCSCLFGWNTRTHTFTHISVCLIFDQLELYLFILCMRDHWTKKKCQRERKEENNLYHRHTDEESRSCCCCFEVKRRIVERNEEKKNNTQQQQQQ